MTESSKQRPPREFWISRRAKEILFSEVRVGTSIYAFNYEPNLGEICGKPGDIVHVIEASYAKGLEAEIERLKKLLASYQHNHFTRDIKEKGVCPSCDRYHEKQERKSLTEKLAVAVADLSKINKIVGAIPFSDQDKWGSTLEIVWGISSKYRDARASIRGQNG